jgi:hypothetical protein
MEGRVPRTPEDFEMAWLRSAEFEQLQREIVAYEEKYAINDEATAVAAFRYSLQLSVAEDLYGQSNSSFQKLSIISWKR